MAFPSGAGSIALQQGETMKIGVMSFNTETTIRVDRLARAAEDRGFDSLWLPEHTHIPVPQGVADPVTGMPPMPGGEFLPEEYRHMAYPFTSLSAAAAVTSTLLLGTCICLINQHHPLNLAKTVATLDRLSDGRFVFGVGAGWNVAEMENHGVLFEDRWPQVVERLAALRTLWRQDTPAYAGRFVEFAPLWQFPKPTRPEGPPVLLGTLDTPFGREQVARHGDGWLPLTFNVERTRRSIEDVKRRMAVHGRDPGRLDVSLFFLPDQVQSRSILDQARSTGASRCIFRLPVKPESEVLKVLDHYARFVRAG